jgi:NAD(P)-dependent dehydrogenase (short-subunit alcohol dehydrogenase family)
LEKLLSGKRAIVTGGNRGLGLAIAIALANDGARVLVAGKDEALSKSAVERIRGLGGAAAQVVADLARPDSAETIVRAAADAFGGADVLVNNAGVFVWKKFLELTREDFQQTIAVNLAAPFYLGQEVSKLMVHQGTGGAIVNIGSIHGEVGDANVVPHCASKFGLIGLTKAMAEALREHRIRVNAICPGAIESDSAARRSESIRERVTQADVATMAVYLASDLAQAITGAVIDMPGSTRTVIRA